MARKINNKTAIERINAEARKMRAQGKVPKGRGYFNSDLRIDRRALRSVENGDPFVWCGYDYGTQMQTRQAVRGARAAGWTGHENSWQDIGEGRMFGTNQTCLVRETKGGPIRKVTTPKGPQRGRRFRNLITNWLK